MADEWYTRLQQTPSLSRPIITTADAKRGYITRYFVKKINDKYSIVEIDSDQFDKFKTNPLYITTSLNWRIVGPKNTKLVKGIITDGVDGINKQSVITADLTFGGLINYIVDYLEFWLYEV